MEERITVLGLFNKLGQEIQNGNGDCFIQVSEYMLPKDFMVHRDETGIWEPTMSCDGIHYSDIENTSEQEEQMENDRHKYWEEHTEDKKSLEDIMHHTPDETGIWEPNMTDIAKYIEYLAENLNRSIKYSEYVGKKVDTLVSLLLAKNIIFLDDWNTEDQNAMNCD